MKLLAALERWLWYIFLATVGWQTRLVLWRADWQFSEWRSLALWGTDVLLVALLALGVLQGWRIRRLTRTDWLLVALIGVAALSALGAPLPAMAWYQVARLVEFILFFFYLRSWAFARVEPRASVLAFVVGSLGEAALAFAQSLVQHDIGMRWAGETLLRTNMHGVAVFFINAHDKFLRAYGTLPHPNVLAVQLMLALWGLLWLYVTHQRPRQRGGVIHALVWAFSGSLLLWALYATYSRTMLVGWAAATAVVMGAIFWPRISGRWRNVAIIRAQLWRALVLAVVVSLAFLALNFPQVRARMTIGSADESVQLRLDYARDSLGSGTHQFLRINWLGVGIGNFTTWLAHTQPTLPAYQLQPAHNLFLLIYTECGIFAVLLFVLWLVLILRESWHAHADQPLLRIGIVAMVSALIFVAFFDHFFWTLQQGRILWWMMLAVAVGRPATTGTKS